MGNLRDCNIKICGRAEIYLDRTICHINDKSSHYWADLCENISIQIEGGSFIITADEVLSKYLDSSVYKENKEDFPSNWELDSLEEITKKKYWLFGPKKKMFRMPSGKVNLKDRKPFKLRIHNGSLIIEGNVDTNELRPE